MEHVIDAKGKKIGRVATEAAMVLMGKHAPSFERHLKGDATVRIVNAEELAITQKKADTKVYTRYTGHPGGLRKSTLKEVREKKGIQEVLKKAVYGMLPGNKLRAPRMKRLIIE